MFNTGFVSAGKQFTHQKKETKERKQWYSRTLRDRYERSAFARACPPESNIRLIKERKQRKKQIAI